MAGLFSVVLFYGGDVETSGLSFELHETPPGGAHVEKHFGEEVLEVSVVDCPGGVEAMELYVGEVERSSEPVGRGIAGVYVDAAQPAHA